MLFRKDGKTSLNTCVGDNGIQIDIRLADGYASVPEILISHIVNGNIHQVDDLVFPLVYSARHAIELYLKDALRVLNMIRGKGEIDLTRLEQTHSFAILKSYLNEINRKTDRRIRPQITSISGYLDEFSQIDDNGQTFRYSRDSENNLNLKSQRIISLDYFILEFRDCIRRIKKLAWHARSLYDEYKIGTYTNDFSRRDLECMSRILPPYKTWAYDNKIKERIDYISRRTQIAKRRVCAGIDLIKTHHEFAGNLGINNVTRSNNSGIILSLFEAHNSYFAKYPPEYGVVTSLLDDASEIFSALEAGEYSRKLSEELAKSLSESEIQYISSLIELGRIENFCEDFDDLFNDIQADQLLGITEQIENIITNHNLQTRLFAGLKKNGKIDLIAELENKPISSIPMTLAKEFAQRRAKEQAWP